MPMWYCSSERIMPDARPSGESGIIGAAVAVDEWNLLGDELLPLALAVELSREP